MSGLFISKLKAHMKFVIAFIQLDGNQTAGIFMVDVVIVDKKCQ